MAKEGPSSLITPIIYPPIDNTNAIQLNEADGVTTVLDIDTTNNRVGIGTTSPAAQLEIKVPTGQTNAALKITESANTGYSLIQLDRGASVRSSSILFSTTGTGNWYIGTLYNGGASNSNFSINTTNLFSSSKLTLLSSGYVGINTSAPTTGLNVWAASVPPTTGPANVDIYATDDNVNNIDKGGMLSFSGISYSTAGGGPIVTAFGSIAGRKENTSDNNTRGYLQINSTGREVARFTSRGNLLIGTTSEDTANYPGIQLSGQQADVIEMVRETTASTAGNNLIIQAGGSTSGSTDKTGGDLILNSGTATGNGGSKIQFICVRASQGAGTSDRTPAGGAILWSEASGGAIFAISNTGGSSTGLPQNYNTFALGGQTTGYLAMYRDVTAATAGQPLVIQSGGSVSGGTDLAGGQLILSPGISTGLGIATATIKSYTVATATGTSDNTTVDGSMFGCYKALTNNSAIAIVNATLASNTVVAGTINYAVEVFNGTDLQVEVGVISYMCTNKGGVFSGNACVKTTNQQNMTSGTLAVTFAISAANPAVISVNANSSLTPSTGYPRLRYVINNLVGQAIAIQ